jgi:hypothetical protein
MCPTFDAGAESVRCRGESSDCLDNLPELAGERGRVNEERERELRASSTVLGTEVALDDEPFIVLGVLSLPPSVLWTLKRESRGDTSGSTLELAGESGESGGKSVRDHRS